MKKLALTLSVCLSAMVFFSCNDEGTGETPKEDTAAVAPKKTEPCVDCNDTLCQNEQIEAHRIDSLMLDTVVLKNAGGIRFAPKVYTAQQIQDLIANVDCMNKVLVCSEPGTNPTSNNGINLRIDDRKEDLIEVYYTLTLFNGLMRMNPTKFYFYNAYESSKDKKDIVFEVIGEGNQIIYFGDLSGTYPPSAKK